VIRIRSDFGSPCLSVELGAQPLASTGRIPRYRTVPPVRPAALAASKGSYQRPKGLSVHKS
jgi:hypothetical protein